MSLLVLDEHQVRSLLTMGECIEAMAEVLSSLARGELHQPLRPVTRPEGSDMLMGLMPAYRGGERPAWSLKEIVIAPGNPARGLDAHQGAVLLHDGETGQLRALLNASAITEIRTAAVSGGRDACARAPGSERRRDPRRRRPGALPRRCDAHGASRTRRSAGGRDATAARPRTSLRGADVVCTCTSAREPILRREWLAPERT